MACFVVPVAEAIVTSVATRILESKENKSEKIAPDNVRFSTKLKWLSKLLWGGSFLLAFEHVWHGEIQPFFPFLTALKNPESTHAMLHEMATVGVSMSIIVTVAWIGMLIITGILKNRKNCKKDLTGETT
ncbi:MAG: hypothetical protein K2K06_06855 [Oscillospiraceae bacterium]|nr:hypothetical protein [Ruminococcus sp.]MDE6707736.1 hypothetical protein [Oscillospiraceae bacterium]